MKRVLEEHIIHLKEVFEELKNNKIFVLKPGHQLLTSACYSLYEILEDLNFIIFDIDDENENGVIIVLDPEDKNFDRVTKHIRNGEWKEKIPYHWFKKDGLVKS